MNGAAAPRTANHGTNRVSIYRRDAARRADVLVGDGSILENLKSHIRFRNIGSHRIGTRLPPLVAQARLHGMHVKRVDRLKITAESDSARSRAGSRHAVHR